MPSLLEVERRLTTPEWRRGLAFGHPSVQADDPVVSVAKERQSVNSESQ